MFGSLINRVSIAIVSAIALLALITGAVLARSDRIEGDTKAPVRLDWCLRHTFQD